MSPFAVIVLAGWLGLNGSSAAFASMLPSSTKPARSSAPVEVELGLFALEREEGEVTLISPTVSLAYPWNEKVELIGEFEVEHTGADTELTDPALFVNTEHDVEWIKQYTGMDLASEVGILLPASVPEERGFGVEALVIGTRSWGSVVGEVQLGGGLSRKEHEVRGIGELHLEVPLGAPLRLGNEINAEVFANSPPEVMFLLKLIGRLPQTEVEFNLEAGKGLSDAAPDWEVTLEITFEIAARK